MSRSVMLLGTRPHSHQKLKWTKQISSWPNRHIDITTSHAQAILYVYIVTRAVQDILYTTIQRAYSKELESGRTIRPDLLFPGPLCLFIQIFRFPYRSLHFSL